MIPANHAVAGIAYGASLTTSEVLITGGSNATRHFANVWLISMESGKPTYRERPPLPVPVSQMAAAIVGRRVHVIGGIEMPNATTASPRHFSLDLDEVATAAGVGDALYLFGGCSLAADADGRAVRSYACDAWWYAGGAWTRLPDMPRGRRQRPRPRPFTTRASSSSRATTEHSLPVGASHKGFTRDILRFDSTNRTWHAAGALTTAPPMTVPTAPWRDGFIFFSGEVRPGVSTPQVFVYVPSR